MIYLYLLKVLEYDLGRIFSILPENKNKNINTKENKIIEIVVANKFLIIIIRD